MARRKSSHHTQRMARSVRAYQTYLQMWRKPPMTQKQRDALAFFLEVADGGKDDRRVGDSARRTDGASAPPKATGGVLASLGV